MPNALRRLPTSVHPSRLRRDEDRPGEAARNPPGVETAGHVEHDVAEFVGDGEPCRSPQSSAFTTKTGTGRSPDRRARAARPPTVSSASANTLTPRSWSSSTKLRTGRLIPSPSGGAGVERDHRENASVRPLRYPR